jgi:hypothetical protein
MEVQMTNNAPGMAIYYEHPEWFRPLFAELNRRGVPYIPIDAGSHAYDPRAKMEDYLLVFNRMSASAYLRGHGNAIFSQVAKRLLLFSAVAT